MRSISSTIEQRANIIKRNNVNKEILINVDNVNTYKDEILEKLLESISDKPRGIAQMIAEKLQDSNNLNFHIKTAKCNEPSLLFESLSITLDAYGSGLIKTTKAKYYIGVLKQKGVKW